MYQLVVGASHKAADEALQVNLWFEAFFIALSKINSGQKQTKFPWSNFQVHTLHLLQNSIYMYELRKSEANRVGTVQERLTSSSRQSLRRGHTVRTRGREVTIIISCGQTVVRLEMESGWFFLHLSDQATVHDC